MTLSFLFLCKKTERFKKYSTYIYGPYIVMHILLLSFTQEIYLAEEGGLFDFNATLPFMMLQFLILMFLLNTIFYKPVIDILDRRSDHIRDSLTTASACLLKANDLTEQYEKALAESRKEAQNTIRNSQKEAQDIVANKIKQAQQEAENLVHEAYNQLNIQKEQVLKTLEDQVETLSDEIKLKILNNKVL